VSKRGTADRLSPEELRAWQGFLRTGTRLERSLDADLRRESGLSGKDYDVLIQLGLAAGRRLPMTALAAEVLMSPSGLSRLVDDLERRGLVERERHETDARSVEVVLTATGRKDLRAANRRHLKLVRELFLDRLDDDQLRRLAAVWDATEPTP
jgi:DNA-binding MarR family transcriptional regulator